MQQQLGTRFFRSPASRIMSGPWSAGARLGTRCRYRWIGQALDLLPSLVGLARVMCFGSPIRTTPQANCGAEHRWSLC
jgi:hypothetical protein